MAVAFDARTPGATGQVNNGAGGTIATWNHTITGANTILFVGVAVGDDAIGDNTASVTFGGDTMTSLIKQPSNNGTAGYVELFYKLYAAQTATIAVSVTNSPTDIEAGAVSFTGVDQTTPLGAPVAKYSTGPANPSSDAVASAVGNMVVDLVCQGRSIDSSNQTIRWKAFTNTNNAAGAAAMSTAAGAASVTMSYTSASPDDAAIVAVDIKATSESTSVTLADAGAETDTITGQLITVAGPNYGSSTASIPGIDATDWVNPGNVYADDTSYATWSP